MSVNDGQAASATTYNEAYISRKAVDTNTLARIDYENVLAVSGPSIFNGQRQWNSLASALGIPTNQLKDYVPAWADNTIGASTDSAKLRIEALQAYALALSTQIASSPTWTKQTYTYADFSTAGLTFDLAAHNVSAKELVQQIVLKHTTPFSNGLITAVELDVGIVGDESRYITAHDVFQATGDEVFAQSSPSDLFSFGAGTTIIIRAIAVGDNLDQLIAGEIDLYVLKTMLP